MSDEQPRLYLITPVIADALAFLPAFEAAISATDIACILLRYEARDKVEAKKIIKTLAPKAQKLGAACLIENDFQLAVHADCDGVHMNVLGEPLREALAALQPGRIVGAGELSTRDDAMEAGEAGVDYLMFGGPDGPETQEGIIERTAWWGEIFNVPCIGYARELEAVARLAKAGADFISLCDCIWKDARGPAAAMLEAADLLGQYQEALP